MKDYRPLLSNVANLLDSLVDHKWSETEEAHYGYTEEEVIALANDVTEMFNEMDTELEGGERY
jgi:hypothetical protein